MLPVLLGEVIAKNDMSVSLSVVFVVCCSSDLADVLLSLDVGFPFVMSV